jgi:hypothetical protein
LSLQSLALLLRTQTPPLQTSVVQGFPSSHWLLEVQFWQPPMGDPLQYPPEQVSFWVQLLPSSQGLVLG